METVNLPSFPGYSINKIGEVFSPTGSRLTVDSRGRVRVRIGGKVSMEYLATLLADADLLRSEQHRLWAEEKVDKAEKKPSARMPGGSLPSRALPVQGASMVTAWP